ncbi:MAG: hypothetical protein Q9226_003220 [Calogaya cf. arnoldii]
MMVPAPQVQGLSKKRPALLKAIFQSLEHAKTDAPLRRTHVPIARERDQSVMALKEQLMREIQQLQAENRSLTQLNSFLNDKNDVMEEMLQSLKDDGQGGEIVSRLMRGGADQQSIPDSATQAMPQQLDVNAGL